MNQNNLTLRIDPALQQAIESMYKLYNPTMLALAKTVYSVNKIFYSQEFETILRTTFLAMEPSIKWAMAVKELVSPSLAKAAVQFAQHAKYLSSIINTLDTNSQNELCSEIKRLKKEDFQCIVKGYEKVEALDDKSKTDFDNATQKLSIQESTQTLISFADLDPIAIKAELKNISNQLSVIAKNTKPKPLYQVTIKELLIGLAINGLIYGISEIYQYGQTVYQQSVQQEIHKQDETQKQQGFQDRRMIMPQIAQSKRNLPAQYKC